MRRLRFALPGTVLLFFLLCSCSFGEEAVEEVVVSKDGTALTKEEEAEPTEGETEDPEEDPGDGEDEEDPENGEEEEPPEEIPQAAIFLGWELVSGDTVVFEFSQPVTVAELDFGPGPEIVEVLEEDCTVTVVFAEELAPGLRVEASLSVEDQHGNRIDVQGSFRSKNNRVPKMLINELRTEYNSKTFKAEFIEFRMLSGGNLGALRVFVVRNEGNTGAVSKDPVIYEFEPVEVESGEYVVIHLRTLEEACSDEYGDDLAESGGADASATARDFWVPGNTERLRKTDAIYVLDQDDKVLDAVMLSEKPDPQWGKIYFSRAAEFLFSQDAWTSPEGTVCTPLDAVDSSGIKTSYTRSISRDEAAENTHTKADWYMTVNGGATPGLPNNPNHF